MHISLQEPIILKKNPILRRMGELDYIFGPKIHCLWDFELVIIKYLSY